MKEQFVAAYKKPAPGSGEVIPGLEIGKFRKIESAAYAIRRHLERRPSVSTKDVGIFRDGKLLT